MNNAAATHGASTGKETGTFLPFVGVNLRDPSSAGAPIQGVVAPYSTRLVPLRSETSDPKTQCIIQAGVTTFRLWSLGEQVCVQGFRLLGENTSTIAVGQSVYVFTSPKQSETLDFEGDVATFYSTLVANQEPLGKDFERVLYDNLWDLYV
jgi:hypothetical protein